MKPHMKLLLLAMLFCVSGAAWAGVLPEPDVIYYGATVITDKPVRLFVETDLITPLAECPTADVAANGDRYVLRTPMDALKPLEGKNALIYVGYGLVKSVPLPAPGTVVNLDLGEPSTLTDLEDTDEDGLPDVWEMAFFGNLDYGPDDDPDNDGYTNLEEYQNGTRPSFPDVDVCLSDNAGDLDITDTRGQLEEQVVVSVQINGAPNGVDTFGFDVTFDKTVLAYENAEAGELAAGFSISPGLMGDQATVRITGINPSGEIEAGAEGELARIFFRVKSEKNSAFGLINLREDLNSEWIFSGGCFTAGCGGDVNRDGEITPADALAIFEKTVGVCPTTAGLACDDICSDVNRDGRTTSADALCVFNKALNILDCLE